MPFSSLSQVLLIILGSKPQYLHREVAYESLYQIWRGTDLPEPEIAVKYTLPAVTGFNPDGHIGNPHDISIR